MTAQEDRRGRRRRPSKRERDANKAARQLAEQLNKEPGGSLTDKDEEDR